jgi:ribonuclease P protein subunit RPR2
MTGIEATKQLVRELPGTRVVMFSAHEERDIVLSVVKAGAHGFVVKGDSVNDIIRAVRAAADGRSVLSDRVTAPILEELVQVYHAERRRADEAVEMVRGFVTSFAKGVESRDQGTGDHSKRVVSLALRILSEMDPALAADPMIQYGYLLHDIGKIGVPDGILLKAGNLAHDELRVMRSHAALGAELIQPVLPEVAPIVRHHHEWFDGSGYPDGLRREEIPLQCRAFAVADSFDAMTSDRPYRAAMSLEAAIDELAAGRATQFDPDALDTFFRIIASVGS